MTLLGAFNRLDWLLAYFWNLPYRRRMGALGEGVKLGRGLRIESPEFLFLGDRVRVSDYCRFSILGINRQAGSPDVVLSPRLEIGSDSYIGSFSVFSCMSEISIGRKVAIADHCYIADLYHGFENVDLPPIDQYVKSHGPVRIGDGAWVGAKVTVLSGVTIGKCCVIGANSVVTRDIPDYHVAAGAPARVIRRIGPAAAEGRGLDA